MRKVVILFLFLNLFPILTYSSALSIQDQPNDDGTGAFIVWDLSEIRTREVSLWRNDTFLQKLTEGEGRFRDKGLNKSQTYVYYLKDSGDKTIYKTPEFSPQAEYFNTDKISLILFLILVGSAIIYFILSAKSGKELYIRKIAGLESIDEAVGRATEMGQPVLFVPGINDIDDMQTIAGLTILRQVARKAAEYDTSLIVPVARSMVLSTAREVVRTAFLEAGRPDAYQEDNVFYLTDDQFGYVSGVDGIIVREKPAANFLLGSFYAESLILAETGFASGAIQVAGTAMPSQLPFFVAACDYTLIGEELFAASAYLSRDPQQLGSLKGQDVGKAIFVIVLTIGIILEISGISFLKDFLIIH